MPDLFLDLNFSELENATAELRKQVEEKLAVAAQSLAIQAHSFIVDQAQSKLHSRRQMYVDALDVKELTKGVWQVTLEEKVRWIDDGLPAHSMLPDLLSSPKAKTTKDGGKYIVIPFQHSKGGPSSQTNTQKMLVGIIKKALKDRSIPFRKLERNNNGTPKLGLLHKFDIMAPSPKNPKHSNHILEGISIYQRQKSGGGVSRDIMTFRIASSKQLGTGKWDSKGTPPMHLFEAAYDEVQKLWETQVKPDLIAGLGL